MPGVVLGVIVLGALLLGWAALQPYVAGPPQDKGQPPRVVDAYAAKVIRPEDHWLVFIRAEDPNGDMKSIAAELWQAGVGYYPTEVNMLKAEDGTRFSGYLVMKTPGGANLTWDEFELTLIVRDSRMNGSRPVKLPLTFDQGAAKQEIPETWQEAANHQICWLMFNIQSSWFYSRGGH